MGRGQSRRNDDLCEVGKRVARSHGELLDTPL